MKGLKRTAVMVVLRCESQFLLLKRANEPNRGLYVPVGGKVEPYEDPYQTGLREVAEETGIRLQKLRYMGSLVETSPVEYNWWCSIYMADIPWQEAPPCDEGKLEWIDFSALETLATPATDWHIYQYMAREQPFAMRAIFDENLKMIFMEEEIEGKILI
ncbi:MAG: NUDIX hydrolase [Lewinella sp.]|uniref:NUDIX hydrolase n=1 Tax=Lewinella sp. TaxID=2004506 RepID=UPI003D6A097C